MPDILEIITAVIGIFLIVTIGVFILSIVRNWGKAYRIYWGAVVFLSIHMLLFAIVLFIQTAKLPTLLKTYTLGMLSLLDKFIGF